MTQQSKRLDQLPPYVFVSIAEKIRAITAHGHTVFRLDIGNPDMPPPIHVTETLQQVVSSPDVHGYSGYRGIKEFREAVASYYQTRFNVALNPETEVLPLLGSKEGIVNLSLAYLDNESISLVPHIGYPAYSMGARIAGADIHWVDMDAENDYQPMLKSLPKTVTNKAKLLWINYPNNPTGGVANPQQYQQIIEFCQRHDIILASDNPYVDITYDGYIASSALQHSDVKDNLIEFMSFSKTYNMAGWRLGAAVGHADIIARLLHMKSNMDSGHFKPIYFAGMNALAETSPSWILNRNHIYQKRRDQILEALPEIGLSAKAPKAAMYVWAEVDNSELVSNYTERALQEAHVSLAPGIAYGPGGEGYVRISIGVKDEILKEALARLREWYKQL